MIALRHCPDSGRKTYHNRLDQAPDFDGYRPAPQWSCKPCLGEPEPRPGSAREKGDLDEASPLEPVCWSDLFLNERP